MRCFLMQILLLVLLAPAWAAEPDLEAIRAGAEAQLAIEKLRQQKHADWNAVRERYAVLLPLVRQSDARWGTGYEAEIDAALVSITAGQDVGVHQQTLAKGLQHVVVLAMEQELKAAGPETPARVAAYFEGVRPTLKRRDKDFFGGAPTLEAAADAALARLASGEMAARRDLMDVLHRAYGLSVVYEMQEVERLRGADMSQCAVKVREGVVFYRILATRVERHNPQAHRAVTAMLAASCEAMSAAEMERQLNAGLSGLRLR